MTLRYLLDTHVLHALAEGLRRRHLELIVWRVGEPPGPPSDAPDPDILNWCESNDFVLITKDRSSMPVHLADHLARGGHIPGIFILNPDMTLGDIIENLLAAADLSFENEYLDQIRYLPL
jgi:predicted nuclease of predicted toxin-antitoxin system